ncbi:uncharacterized protein LOC113746717 [Larimichthys crocea]|uniref:uncharacterized protein LOC113746717 n=1 Tax=Larimichthys crocea TaxID=215358 RepID=UPI000F5E3FB6|nr:uncharacterized protein LOC113746717 [Larimichthys crocea]
MPSVKQKNECHHAVWLEKAFFEQTQANKTKRRPLVNEQKWTDPESQLKMTHAQDLFSKNMKRKSMSEDESKSTLMSVSTASSKTNLSESSKQKSFDLEGRTQVFPNETPSLAHDSNTFSTEKPELPSTSDLSKTQFEITLTSESSSPEEQDEKLSFPKQSEGYDLDKPSSETPDSFCQTAQDGPEDKPSSEAPDSFCQTAQDSPEDKPSSETPDLFCQTAQDSPEDEPSSETPDSFCQTAQDSPEDKPSSETPDSFCQTAQESPEDKPSSETPDSFCQTAQDGPEDKPSSETPDSLCQTAQDSPGEQMIRSSEFTPTPPGSGSPQLDKLLSDLEEMKLKFIPETLDTPLSESSVESPEDDLIFEYEELSPEDEFPTETTDPLRVSMPSEIQLGEDSSHTNVAVTEPAHCQTSIQDEPEIVTITSGLTKTSETSIPSSLGSCNDSPVSPTDSNPPESPQRFCEVTEPSLSSSSPLDELHHSKHDVINVSEAFSPASFLTVAAKSHDDAPEEHLADLPEEDSTTDILQSEGEVESALLSTDSKDVTQEMLTQGPQDQPPHLGDETSVEATQNEDFSSQSLSDLTPETVISARHFSFENLMPYPSAGNFETSSDEDRPRTSGASEGSLTSVDLKCFSSQPKHKAEMTSSTSDEEYSIPPGYAETCSTTTMNTHMPPEYAKVVCGGADSPTFEYSDPEPYFDCKQASSDFSETEPDEPDQRTRSRRDQPHDHVSHPRVQEKVNRMVLLSSGSEDYEDASFVHEPLDNINEENEESINYSGTSDEEFILCEASQLPPVCEIGAYDDTDKYLTRVRRDLVNHPDMQVFPRAELNQILYLLQKGMTANPLATWMGSKTPYNPYFVLISNLTSPDSACHFAASNQLCHSL